MVMRKLAAVEEARAVMTEGMEWGVWKWLLEKRRVQEIADRATAALHEADRKVKAAWSDELKTAYKELVEKKNLSGAAGRKKILRGSTSPLRSGSRLRR